MGVTTTMQHCTCGHPVKVQRPKGTPRPVITACNSCRPL